MDNHRSSCILLGVLSGITNNLSHTPKTLRLRLRGWSQRRLAREAGVSVNTVASIEHGNDVSTRSLHDVAEALGIATWELMRAMDCVGAPIVIGAVA